MVGGTYTSGWSECESRLRKLWMTTGSFVGEIIVFIVVFWIQVDVVRVIVVIFILVP
jgi:hypothetical protein